MLIIRNLPSVFLHVSQLHAHFQETDLDVFISRLMYRISIIVWMRVSVGLDMCSCLLDKSAHINYCLCLCILYVCVCMCEIEREWF